MIDIIIPAYNAHSTIKRTLASIALQNCKDNISVCIVDDCSKKDYSSEIKLFAEKLNIKQIRLEKNSGPGIARQVGIDNTSNNYIMFLDADDLLYDSYTISYFLRVIEKRKIDMIYGIILDEKSNNELYLYCNHQGCLHGKLYRRDFIKKNNINFFNSYFHEDNAFNRLFLMYKPNVLFLNNYVYVYKNNTFSITNINKNNFNNIDIFIDNMIKILEVGIKEKCDESEIANVFFNTIFYVFKVYISNFNNNDKNAILGWSKPLLMYYNKYSKKLSQIKIMDIYIGFGPVDSIITFYDFIESIKKYEGDCFEKKF